jgi:hypothetical protein
MELGMPVVLRLPVLLWGRRHDVFCCIFPLDGRAAIWYIARAFGRGENNSVDFFPRGRLI